MLGINHALLLDKFCNSGMSYEGLARITQFSRGTLYNVMFGVTIPSQPVICGLIKALLLTKEEASEIFFYGVSFPEELMPHEST